MNIKEIGQKTNKHVLKFSNNKIVRVISSGMARILPITIVASVAMILRYLPIDAWTKFIASTGIDSLLGVVLMMTTNLFSIFIVISLASEMAKIYKKEQLNAILISLLSFMIVTPMSQVEVGGRGVLMLSFDNLGSRGIFVAMIVAIVATRLYVLFLDIGFKIKLPKEVPSAIANSLEPLFIAIAIVGIFLVFTAVVRLTPYSNIHDLVYTILQKPLEGFGGSLVALLVITLIAEGFWWFGIHGSNVVAAVIATVYTPLAIANMQAVAAGLAPQFILNTFFYSVYKGPRHLALALILVLLARSKHLKAIGKISIVPGFFGISEPMKFGIPMIFNPLLLIPMALTPVVSLVIAYVASVINFIPPVTVNVPWIMPPFISGFIASGLPGVVVQMIQFAVIIAMYYPFFKMLDNQKISEEKMILDES